MNAWASLAVMYLFTLPLAVLAARWGIAQLRRHEPPEGAMRSIQLGQLVTDPLAKLSLCRQHGMMALIFAAAMVIGPAISIWNRS